MDPYVWHLFARAYPPRRLVAFGGPADGREGDDLVATVPLHDEEAVVGATRAARSWDTVEDRIHRTWLAMAGLGVLAIGVAALVASYEARRLAADPQRF